MNQAGARGAVGAATAGGGGDGGGFSMEDVAKHAHPSPIPGSLLVGRVFDVTNFLKDHHGDEVAILTFTGKDAT